MNLQLEHFLTFVNTRNIDDYVEKYRVLGFVLSEETRSYKPGLRNRFILLGCEYLELVWVENEDEFVKGGSEEFARMYNDLPAMRAASRPFSIGFISPDVEVLHQEWIQSPTSLVICPSWNASSPQFSGNPRGSFAGCKLFCRHLPYGFNTSSSVCKASREYDICC